jgi:hypothetical protein
MGATFATGRHYLRVAPCLLYLQRTAPHVYLVLSSGSLLPILLVTVNGQPRHPFTDASMNIVTFL